MLNLSKGGNINLAKEASGVTEFSIGLDCVSIDAMKRPTIAFL